MDNFYEQLETAKEPIKYKVLKNSFIFFAVFAVLTLGMGQIPIALISALISGLTFFFKRKAYVEYEYVFTNGAVDIDAIYEMKRRKRVLSFSAKDIELLAEDNSAFVKDFTNAPDKTMDCYPSTSEKKVYVAMITGGTERLQLRFTPSKDLVDMFYRVNPRATKKIIG